jgi:hypothetical protein
VHRISPKRDSYFILATDQDSIAVGSDAHLAPALQLHQGRIADKKNQRAVRDAGQLSQRGVTLPNARLNRSGFQYLIGPEGWEKVLRIEIFFKKTSGNQ